MLAARDYYAVLGVTPNSEDVVIQAAYKALMRKYHPDANRDVAMSKWAADFNEAFSVIGRADRRAEYDAQRWELQRRQADRRQGDLPAARDDADDPDPQASQRAAQWKSWAKKGAGVVVGIMAAKLLTVLAASLDRTATVPMPVQAYRPSDAAVLPFVAPDEARVVMPRPAKAKKSEVRRSPAPASPPMVAKADMVRAARRSERIFGRDGVAGSIAFSRSCHAKAVSGGDWSSFDFCAAFDDAARMADLRQARAARRSPDVYFLGVTSAASQIAAFAPLSRDAAALARRIRDIRGKVAAHTGSAPAAAVAPGRAASHRAAD